VGGDVQLFGSEIVIGGFIADLPGHTVGTAVFYTGGAEGGAGGDGGGGFFREDDYQIAENSVQPQIVPPFLQVYPFQIDFDVAEDIANDAPFKAVGIEFQADIAEGVVQEDFFVRFHPVDVSGDIDAVGPFSEDDQNSEDYQDDRPKASDKVVKIQRLQIIQQ